MVVGHAAEDQKQKKQIQTSCKRNKYSLSFISEK